MKNFLLLLFRVNVFGCLAVLFSTTVGAQETVVVSTNKSGDVKVAQTALPVLSEKPPLETGNKMQTANRREKFSVLSEKPSGDLFGRREKFFCSTPNSYEKPRGNFDIKAVGALDCGAGDNEPCYWTKPFILVGFINGTPELKQVVRDVIAEWTTWANVGFIIDDNGNFPGDTADIKISFNANNRHSSLVGIDAWHSSARKSKDEPTMNLGFLNTPVKSADGQVLSWVRGTTLHEFGHALGLKHEHQNPAGGIQWNRETIVQELSGPPNNWTLDIIERNIFRALSRTQTQFTQYDASSIMHYPFPAAWTKNGVAIPDNDNLSETDKDFVAKNYPRSRSTFDDTQYYRLTTSYNNRRNCLGLGFNETNGSKTYFPYYFACDEKNGGQSWRFTRMTNGDYRVTNFLTGDQLSLNDFGLGYYSGMDKSGNYNSQHWTITSLGKFHRLSSVLNGTLHSLTAAITPDTRTSMMQTAHWSNQLWEFIPAGKMP